MKSVSKFFLFSLGQIILEIAMSVKSHYGVFAQLLVQYLLLENKYFIYISDTYTDMAWNQKIRQWNCSHKQWIRIWPVKWAQTKCHLQNTPIAKPSSTTKHDCLFMNLIASQGCSLFSYFFVPSLAWCHTCITRVTRLYYQSRHFGNLFSYELPPHALNINIFLLDLFIIPSESPSFKTKSFTQNTANKAEVFSRSNIAHVQLYNCTYTVPVIFPYLCACSISISLITIFMQPAYKSCQNNTTYKLRTGSMNCFSCFFFSFPSTSFRNPWALTVGIAKPSGRVPLWLILHLI